MTATTAQIARLRRMTNEPDDSTYDDETLAEYITRYPLLDERGQEPYTWDTSTRPPTPDANEDWIPTYDLHAAAGDIWEEKAAVVAVDFAFQADGGSYQRQQVHEQYLQQARYHRSRRVPRTMRLYKWPEEPDRIRTRNWIGNLPEEDN